MFTLNNKQNKRYGETGRSEVQQVLARLKRSLPGVHTEFWKGPRPEKAWGVKTTKH